MTWLHLIDNKAAWFAVVVILMLFLVLSSDRIAYTKPHVGRFWSAAGMLVIGVIIWLNGDDISASQSVLFCVVIGTGCGFAMANLHQGHSLNQATGCFTLIVWFMLIALLIHWAGSVHNTNATSITGLALLALQAGVGIFAFRISTKAIEQASVAKRQSNGK